MRGQTLKVSERQTLDHTGDGRSVFGLLFGTDWAPTTSASLFYDRPARDRTGNVPCNVGPTTLWPKD